MRRRSPAEPEGELLADPIAKQLLARASELDAAGRAGATVTELRAAAAEAGISASAFDAALAELQEAPRARVAAVTGHPRRRPRIRTFAVGAVAVIAAAVLALSTRLVVEAPAAAPMVEEAILLRCLSPAEAVELVRPLLRLQTNTIVHSTARAPRVLTIRATPEQLRQVRSEIDRYERDGVGACASPKPGR